MRISLYAAAATLLVSVSHMPAAEHYPGAPASVVAGYVEADGKGLALDGETASGVLKYTVWPDAPGWDTFTVIKSYEIGEVGYNGDKAFVEIIYHNLGQMSGLKFIAKAADETVCFDVVKKGGKWKIIKPQNQPHLTIASAMKALEGIGAKEGKASLKSLSSQE